MDPIPVVDLPKSIIRKEGQMNTNEQLDKRYRSIAWGVLFILIGTLSLIPGDQTSLAILGSGVILLGLNLGRSLSKIPMNGFSLALGAAAFLTGALVIFRSQLGIHFEIELLPVVLIAVGVYWLWPERKTDGSSHS
jgi:hypothetical protein